MATSLRTSLRQQYMIIRAIVLRDVSSRYTESRLGVLLTIIDPLLMIVSLFALRYFLIGQSVRSGIPLVLFIATGYLTYHVFRLISLDVLGATAQRSGMLKLPMITSLDVVIAKIVASIMIYSTVMLLCFLGALLFKAQPPWNLLLVIVAGVSALWIGATTGVIFGVVTRFYPVIRIFYGPVLRAGVFLSGAMYLASELPPWLLPYVGWNPMLHVIELMREAWFRGYVSPLADGGFILLTMLVLTALALWLERMTSGQDSIAWHRILR